MPVYKRLAKAKQVEQTFEGDNQISSPKIQRVPAFLRQNPDFAKYCSPKIISFGPIHHQNENLKLGRDHKMQWSSHYIEEYSKKTNKSASEEAQFLHKIIEDNIGELKKLFSEDVIESYNDKELARMLFVDGCSLLYYMDNVDTYRPEALKIKLDQLMYTWRDILLMENQLPMRLLELLRNNVGADLEYLLDNFRTQGEIKRNGEKSISFHIAKTTHLLDFARSICINTNIHDDMKNGGKVRKPGPECKLVWQTYKNIRDLTKAGIRVMANETNRWTWHNISFTSRWFSGELRLPVFLFNDVSPYFFRNLIAYEMCPDFCNNFECCSFFSFMDSLIDDAEDVKELRLAGVFQNLLGSDEELAKLFNEIGHDLPTKMFSNHTRTDAVAYSQKFTRVKYQIEMHYRNKWKTWLAEAYNTHFNTPWSLLAFLAALLALVLTFIQTLYTMRPK